MKNASSKSAPTTIVELIESDLDVVVWLAHEAVEAIRQSIGLAK